MFNILCTARLFARTGLRPELICPAPTTILGNWYANLLRLGRKQFILFVSEPSLLAIVTPAQNARALREHLILRLPIVLRYLSLPEEWIAAEIEEMKFVHFSKTQSRQILGTMTDFMNLIGYMYDHCGESEPFDTMSSLIDCPCKIINYESPRDRTLRIFRQHYDMAALVSPGA